MAKICINTDVIAAELLGLGELLKATLMVSAAAILSRRDDDLQHNAQAALARFDEMGRRLDGLRNMLFKKRGVSFATRLAGRIKEIDDSTFREALSIIDDRIDRCLDVLRSVLESKHREGVDLFATQAGALGRAIEYALGHLTSEAVMGSPLLFHAFFAQVMEELSSKEW